MTRDPANGFVGRILSIRLNGSVQLSLRGVV
jgi:hypothetical protein